MINESPAPSNVTFKIDVMEKKERFPGFYGIGTQILVVGTLLVIASFFA